LAGSRAGDGLVGRRAAGAGFAAACDFPNGDWLGFMQKPCRKAGGSCPMPLRISGCARARNLEVDWWTD
jgi:hypothetical protein